MRVLFVNENIGGHATTHLHLRRAIAERDDVEARFLDVPAPGLGRKLLGAPVPGLARADLDLQPLRSQLALSRWTRSRLVEAARDVDVVHVFTHNAVLLSAGELRRRPSVVALDTTNAVNSHSLPYRRPTRFTPWTVAATRPFESRVYDAADVLVATSRAAMRSLDEDYAVPSERVRLLRYGIHAPCFTPTAAPGTTAERPRLIFVGRGMERKGGTQLLRVHQRHFADRCDLVLVTHDDVEPRPGVEVVRDVTPGDRRLWELLRSSAAFVFPSLIDQQPNAVMEAMAAGLPTIAHPINAIADMIVDDLTGSALPDAGDDTLAVAIERLLADPAARAAQGGAARARFDAAFTAGRTVDELLGLMHEAVGLHAHRHGTAPRP